MAKPRIYVFLNAIAGKIAQYAAVSEDGACLASCNVPTGLAELARIKLGETSQYVRDYKQYYPNDYELIWIEDINAPENVFIFEQIRAATNKHVQRCTGLNNGGNQSVIKGN